jgi:hypothetical protein
MLLTVPLVTKNFVPGGYMKRSLGSFVVLALALFLSGCKLLTREVSLTLSAHDHEVLKPALVNSLFKYGVLKGACEEGSRGFDCSFRPGRYLKNVNYEYRLLKGGAWRVVILDSKELPLATMLIGDFAEEDLKDKKWVSEDGSITVELGHMYGSQPAPCVHEKICGKPKCCTKCPPQINTLESIVVITFKPSLCPAPVEKPCKPCPEKEPQQECPRCPKPKKV